MATIYQQNAIDMIFYKNWKQLKGLHKPTSQEMEKMSISEASKLIKDLYSKANKGIEKKETKLEGGVIFTNK